MLALLLLRRMSADSGVNSGSSLDPSHLTAYLPKSRPIYCDREPEDNIRHCDQLPLDLYVYIKIAVETVCSNYLNTRTQQKSANILHGFFNSQIRSIQMKVLRLRTRILGCKFRHILQANSLAEGG